MIDKTIHFEQTTWESQIKKAQTAVDNVTTIPKWSMSVTNLATFNKIPDLLADVSKSITDYQTLSQLDLRKMRRAGQNVVQRDKMIHFDY